MERKIMKTLWALVILCIGILFTGMSSVRKYDREDCRNCFLAILAIIAIVVIFSVLAYCE